MHSPRYSWRLLALATLIGAGAAAGIACGVENTSAMFAGVDNGAATTDAGTDAMQLDGAATSGAQDGGVADADSGDVIPSLQTVAIPTFTPPPGTYPAPPLVRIASATPNATIYYTVDGTNPTTASAVYGSPVVVRADTLVRATAMARGLGTSPVASAFYRIVVPCSCTAPVSFNPGSGEYEDPVALGLAFVSAPSTLCYTTDGASPSCLAGVCGGGAVPYSAGSPVLVNPPAGGGDRTVKALACSAGNINSDVTTSIYSFRVANVGIDAAGNQVAGYVATSNTLGAHFSNGAGSADFNLQTKTTGETIRYSYATGPTLPVPPDVNCTQSCALADATCTECTPGALGCQTGALPASTTIKAIGCKTDFKSSALRQLVYDPGQAVTLAEPSPDPTKFYVGAQPITLAATPSDATICYTLGVNNDVEPTCSSATGTCTTAGPLPTGIVAGTYNGASDVTKPLVLEDSTRIRAIACKSGSPTASNAVTALYHLQ